MEELRRVFDKQRRQDTKRLAEIEKERLRKLAAMRAEAINESERRAEETEARLEAIRAKVS